MVPTKSEMLPLGAALPAFSLPTAGGELVSVSDYDENDALLVAFWCNHCPYVKLLKQEFADFSREFGARGLGTVAINANDIKAYPADSPTEMLADIERYDYDFSYVLDESQDVARKFNAVCTPEFYLFDKARKLAYRGRFDEASPGNGKSVTGADLRAAVDAVLSGSAVLETQHPAMGCSIKWKPGS